MKQHKSFRGAAFRYFLLFIFLIIVVGLIPVAIVLPGLAKDAQEGVERLPDFTAQLKNGTLQISGLPQPYVSHEKDSVLVIDTVTTSSVSLSAYFTTTTESGILITRDRLEVLDRDGSEQIQPFWSLPDYGVDKSEVTTLINRFTGPVTIIVIMLLIAVLFYLVIFITKLWSLVVVAGLVWVVAKIINKSWKFSELVTVGLFAMTLPTIISLLLATLGVQLPFINFLALLAFMMAVVITNDGEVAKVDVPPSSV